MHSAEVAEHLNISLGAISESCAEICHRMRKNARLYHTRKTGRLETMTDIFNWEFARSDPLICSKSLQRAKKYRKNPEQKLEELPSKARSLLDVPDDDDSDDSLTVSQDLDGVANQNNLVEQQRAQQLAENMDGVDGDVSESSAESDDDNDDQTDDSEENESSGSDSRSEVDSENEGEGDEAEAPEFFDSEDEGQNGYLLHEALNDASDSSESDSDEEDE